MVVDQIVLVVLTLSLVGSFLLGRIFRMIKLPAILAPLTFGLGLNWFFLHYPLKIAADFHEVTMMLANIGLVLLLFFLGLKVNFKFLRSFSKSSSIMALNAGIIPLELGFFVSYLFGYSFLKSLFVGICLAITAEEVSIAILDELKLIKNKIGQIIIEAGVIGDIFEIIAISLLGIFMRYSNIGTSIEVSMIFIEFVLFCISVICLRYVISPLVFRLLGKSPRKYELFLGSFVVLLIMVLSSELLNYGYILGALGAGLILKDQLIAEKNFNREYDIIEGVETVAFGFLEPLVFIWVGLSIDITSMLNNPWFGIILTIVATAGKLLGSVIGSYFCRESLKEGLLMGWALNARGATELFAILIARNMGIIGADIFSAIVFMAIVTTIISPIVFKVLVTRKFGIR
ncbi:cation:proton antiporter [Candidatus Woesearchaeota archaeon]|nr:cation:proton antiporter [Candidatus Woesearchaeota archaeon]